MDYQVCMCFLGLEALKDDSESKLESPEPKRKCMVKNDGLKVKEKCPVCEYETIERSNLKTHITQKHSKTKQFKCQYCDYSNNQKQDMVIHEEIHQGVKKHECPMAAFLYKW